MEIKRKDKYVWIVDGEELNTVQFIKKTCPSKTIAEDAEFGLRQLLIIQRNLLIHQFTDGDIFSS